MASLDDVMQSFMAAHQAGDTKNAAILADLVRKMQSEQQNAAMETQAPEPQRIKPQYPSPTPTTDQQGNIIDYDKKLNAANAELNPVLAKAAPIYEPIARGGLNLLGTPADIAGLMAGASRAIAPSPDKTVSDLVPGYQRPEPLSRIAVDKLREYAGSDALKRYAGIDNENRLYRPETSMGKVADYATEAGVSAISKNPVTMALGALGGAAGQGVRNIGGSDLEGAATEAAVAISPTIPGMVRSAGRLGSRLFSPTGNVLGNAGYNRMSPEEIGAVFGEAANRIRNADQAGVRINAGQALQNPSISGVEQSLANSPATRDMIAEANAAQLSNNINTVKKDIVGNINVDTRPGEGIQDAVDRLVHAGAQERVARQIDVFKKEAGKLYREAGQQQLSPEQLSNIDKLEMKLDAFARNNTSPNDPAVIQIKSMFNDIRNNPYNIRELPPSAESISAANEAYDRALSDYETQMSAYKKRAAAGFGYGEPPTAPDPKDFVPETKTAPDRLSNVDAQRKLFEGATQEPGSAPSDLQEVMATRANIGLKDILSQNDTYNKAKSVYSRGATLADALKTNTQIGRVSKLEDPLGSYGMLTNSGLDPNGIGPALYSLPREARQASNAGLRYNIGRSIDEMKSPVQIANNQLDMINPSELSNKLSEYFGTPAARENTRAQLIGTMGINAGEQEFQKWKNIADNIALTEERRNISGSLQPTMETNEATRNAAKLATSMITGDAFSATNALTRGLQYVFGREAKNRLASKFVAGSLPEGNKTAAEVGIDSVNRLRDAALNYSQWAKPLKESVGTSTEQLIRSLMRAKQREQEQQGSNQ